jgi:hypothetical protein
LTTAAVAGRCRKKRTFFNKIDVKLPLQIATANGASGRASGRRPGNVAEQNIKLTLNSLSAKAAQSIGESETNPPSRLRQSIFALPASKFRQ